MQMAHLGGASRVFDVQVDTEAGVGFQDHLQHREVHFLVPVVMRLAVFAVPQPCLVCYQAAEIQRLGIEKII